MTDPSMVDGEENLLSVDALKRSISELILPETALEKDENCFL